MRVLVTGGAGRLGIKLCCALVMNGFQVRMFDINTPSTRKQMRNLPKGIEAIWCDVTNRESVEETLIDVDAVVHMAAILPSLTNIDPDKVTKVNVDGTRIIVESIKKKGRPIPFIYISSVVVFGPILNDIEPLSPEKHVSKPQGLYSTTKANAEIIVRTSGIGFVILRLSSHWHSQIFSLSELRYMFRTPLDDLIEISNIDDTILAIINAIREFDKVKEKVLVISSGPKGRMSHRERVSSIMKILGLPMPPDWKFSQIPGSVGWYDTQESEELLHYQKHNFEDCLKDYKKELTLRYSPFLLPLMRFIIGPIFGRFIVRYI